MEKEEILEEEKLESSEPKKEKKNKKNKQIEELTEKLKSLEEETLRAKADLINYRKRKDDGSCRCKGTDCRTFNACSRADSGKGNFTGRSGPDNRFSA